MLLFTLLTLAFAIALFAEPLTPPFVYHFVGVARLRFLGV
jgi:hypothetical protein